MDDHPNFRHFLRIGLFLIGVVKDSTYILVKNFFSGPILKQLGQPDDIKKEYAYSIIDKAFAYHNFINDGDKRFNTKQDDFLIF